MGLRLYSPSIGKNNLTLLFALGLTTVLMLVPTTYALNVSVISDRIGDEFIWGIFASDIVRYIDRLDGDYVSFVDLLNVRIRLTEESMLVTLHVSGEIPTDPSEDVDFAFGILASSSKESFGQIFDPVEYPWFVVVLLYESEPVPLGWKSWLIVNMAPHDASVYDIPFNMKKRHIDISVPTFLLPMTSFYWQGFTYYENTKFRDNDQILNDITNVSCLARALELQARLCTLNR